jgi:hypothetical protein
MQPHNQTALLWVRQLAAVMCDRDAIVCGIFGLTGLLLIGLAIYFGVVPGTD